MQIGNLIVETITLPNFACIMRQNDSYVSKAETINMSLTLKHRDMVCYGEVFNSVHFLQGECAGNKSLLDPTGCKFNVFY